MEFKGESELAYQIRTSNEIYSATWGSSKTTHLMTASNYHMEPDCDTYTMCGKLLPDREHRSISMRNHPPHGRRETFCPKCMALIGEHGLDKALLKDEGWLQAYKKHQAGLPTDVEFVYQYPQRPVLPRSLRNAYDSWLRGQSFKQGAFELKKTDPQNIEMWAHGVLAWKESRAKGETGHYIHTLVAEPIAQFPDSKHMRLIGYFFWPLGVTFDAGCKFAYTRTKQERLDLNWAIRVEKQAESKDYQLSMQERSSETKPVTRVAAPPTSAGDQANRWYSDAMALNEWAATAVANGKKITVVGEEFIPMKFVGAVCKAHFSDDVCITYMSGGMRCGAYISGDRLTSMTSALMKRGRYSTMDSDGEPLSIQVTVK